MKHRRQSQYGVRRKVKKYEEIKVASMSEAISLNTNYIKKSISKIAIVDEEMSKKHGNVAVEKNKTMYSSPKENELDMSYSCEADDETEDSMTAIDAYDIMLNVTAIVKSKPKEVIQESGERKLCTSVDTNVVDQDMVADKKTSKPLKGIMRKSQSNTRNDVKKKVEFCNMSLRSTGKLKCNSSDSDPEAVIIISPPKKLSNSKKKEGIGKKEALETKGRKKTAKKITVKPFICVGKVKKEISSPRRKTRSTNDMVPKGHVSNESTKRNHAATKGTTSSIKEQKSKEENKKEQKGNNKENKGNKKDKKKNHKEAVKMVTKKYSLRKKLKDKVTKEKKCMEIDIKKKKVHALGEDVHATERVISKKIKEVFKCAICDKQFSCKQNVKMHLESAHTVQKYVCRKCGKEYGRPQTLRGHVK